MESVLHFCRTPAAVTLWTPKWQSDYLDILPSAGREYIKQCRLRATTEWKHGGIKWADWYASLLELERPLPFDGNQPAVRIDGRKHLLTSECEAIISKARTFCPWKKGPFEFFGEVIDAEWRSDLKWQRLQPHLRLKGKKVLDIGCHNGYYMFRMAADHPSLVVGIEPVAKPAMNFQFLQHFARQPKVFIEPLGIEDVDVFASTFDVVFCLGILYHHTDPIGLLRKIRACMTPKSELWIDCQGMEGSSPHVLVPRGLYAGAKGIWWVPTAAAIENWLSRAGFKNISTIYSEPLSQNEQRRTAWADIKSLADFLDANNPSQTIEGYPAPWRHYLRAKV